jgi:hypothetical protein
MIVNVTARPRCLPLWTCRTARCSRIASRGTGLIHLLSLYVVSREMGYSKYWERTRVAQRNDLVMTPVEGHVDRRASMDAG